MSGRKSVNPGTWATPSGEALREDDAARLAEEFEADDTALDGVEITYPRRAGRPWLTGGTGTWPQVTFRLSLPVGERAERLATERGTTVAALARKRWSTWSRRRDEAACRASGIRCVALSLALSQRFSVVLEESR